MIDALIKLIRAHRYAFRDEAELQEQIGQVLAKGGYWFVRECRLGNGNRLDFAVKVDEFQKILVLETKIQGSVAAHVSQLHRYASFDEVTALLLVCIRPYPNLPESLYSKPLKCCPLFDRMKIA